RDSLEAASCVEALAHEFIQGPTRRCLDLSGFRQRIRQEHRDRVALVEALAAPIGVEITALFKLIELALGHQNWSPKESVLAAPAMPVDRFANLLAAGCHEAA